MGIKLLRLPLPLVHTVTKLSMCCVHALIVSILSLRVNIFSTFIADMGIFVADCTYNRGVLRIDPFLSFDKMKILFLVRVQFATSRFNKHSFYFQITYLSLLLF